MPELQGGHLRPWLHTLLAVTVILVWAACFVVIKAGLENAPPLFSAALRGLVAVVPLLLASAILGRLRPPRDTWGWLVLLGLSGTALSLGTMYLSVGHAGAAIPSVLANTQALLVAPFAIRFFGETLTRGKLAALVVGLSGVVLTVVPGSVSFGSVEGALFALLASAGIASGTLILKRIGPRVNVLTATTWQYLIGSLPLLLVALFAEEVRGITWSPAFLAGLLFLGLVGSAGTSLVWFLLVQRGELIRLTSFTFLTPVLGLLLATLLFREPLGLINWLGLGLTITGVARLQWSSLEAPAEQGALFVSR